MSTIQPRPRPGTGLPLNDAPGSGGGISKPPRRLSDESRQHLSEVAQQRHREGGFQKIPGRTKKRPSKRRIAELVATAALEEKAAQEIVNVFRDGIAPTQPIQIRLKAAEAWLKVDLDQAKLEQRAARDDAESFDREAALTLLADKLANGHSATLLRKQLERENIPDVEIVEGDATDIE